ncbi:helix-turn-helix domain-containing protein [Comamonas jiangduensis]|uniref:helix-turn-helix domain-containing protein n=1 Tax=Comamonas jiangduensis TaxID=1194168 RepID=UPI0028AECEB1|nr:helix-turn-helix transcriptional regulator [Comamonas jiangduensis]
MTFGERLREERKRLGMNQTELALLGGVVKFTQINYEKDERTPDLDYLAKLEAAGVDAYYILTGKRTPEPTSEQLLPFPQRLERMVQAEQLKGASNALLLRDLLAISQKLAIKLPD